MFWDLSIYKMTVYKENYLFDVLQIEVHPNYFANNEDLILFLGQDKIIIYHVDFTKNQLINQIVRTHKLKVRSLYVDNRDAERVIDVYVVTQGNSFYRITLDMLHKQKWQMKKYLDIPVEIKSLYIIEFRKTNDVFFFLLYDRYSFRVYVCNIYLNYPQIIHSFFVYQLSSSSNYYHVFWSKNSGSFYLSSNQESLFFELIINKNAICEIHLKDKASIDFSLYVLAKNDFFSKSVLLVSPVPEQHWFLAFFVEIYNSFQINFWIVLGVCTVMLLLSLFHLYAGRLKLRTFMGRERNKKISSINLD